ncbi:Nif3-like dinuclear metal center hexameric protein [Peptacetobacter sp.]|uniref:Nif3-like dinuclear metal center hexameric protein n=1 Tax=Peptacetobacter sp. TaxID=2991975 RepID=UPI002617EB36|nr:Nif3-like dinuclear metal center hexameric protein [Peptacetobacter sp.]
MKLNDIITKIENKYPLNLAYEWDNVGLIVGDLSSDIKKIMTVLEANESVVDEAIDKNVNLIVTHHPFIFGKIKKITTDDYKGKLIHKLIKNNISIYSMHTNFDIAFDGLNDYFMKIMEIKNTKVLDKIDSYQDYCDGETYGLGRIGELEESIKLKDLCNKIKKILKADSLRVVGDLEKEISKVAVVTGSGSEFAKLALNEGADVILTGDVKYHDAQDVLDMGMNLVDCGHFDSEDIFKDVMSDFLKNEFKDIEVMKSEINLNPFNIV